MLARIEMSAMTIRSSMSVNPGQQRRLSFVTFIAYQSRYFVPSSPVPSAFVYTS